LNSLKQHHKKSNIVLRKENLADFDVFIIDTIGILTKIYSYADIAFVGGGFGNPGVHNLLEPATLEFP
jgi:3-deoxy-D-manno-octulosonic-acid transferase